MRSLDKTSPSVAILLVWVLLLAMVGAQNPDRSAGAERPAPPDSTRPARQTNGDAAKRILDELSEEERQRFRAAINKVWHAEQVEMRRREMQEANLAYRSALQQEARKLDVSAKVRSVLLRLLQLRLRPEGVRPNGNQRSDLPPRPRSEADRGILAAARIKAEKTPAVIEAKRNIDKAVTTRGKNVASGRYREVMRRAMIDVDQRVERILRLLDQRSRAGTPTDRNAAGDRRRELDDRKRQPARN